VTVASQRRAGLVRRLVALAYEALLVTALVLILGFVMLPLVSPAAAHPSGPPTLPPWPARVGLFTVTFGVLAAYFIWCWTDGRSTLPQKTWHLRIVATDGAPPSRRSALARYLAAWIGPLAALIVYGVLQPRALGGHAAWLVALNYLWAFIDRDRQFLHDRIAGTRVVAESGSGTNSRNRGQVRIR
jgi:uncharacterized RDD family membrane protein YckC